jgi:UDP-N-acetylmuramoylalanine--D-glutamate ligase
VKDWHGQRVAVVGLGRSGVALTRVLGELGARVLVSESRSAEALVSELQALPPGTFDLESGGHTDRLWQGQDAVVISPGVPYRMAVLEQARQHGVPVIGEIEVAYRLASAPMIAVTGTNGKSTTTSLIHAMLEAGGQTAVLAGNIGIPLVGEVGTQASWIVAEISSFQLESIETFRPHVGVALNITSDHLDRHGTMGEYRAAKARLFENQTLDDYAVLNADDPAVTTLADGRPSRVHRFSRHRAVELGCWLEGTTIRSHLGPYLTLPEDRTLHGVHNEENILAAATVGQIVGLPGDALVRVLRRFAPLHHRMELVERQGGVTWLDDSKGTNPGAVVAALESVRQPVVLIAGGKDKGMDFAPLARALPARVKALVLIGEATPRLEAAARQVGFTAVHRAETLAAAVTAARSLAAPGDCVLLSPACASFDMFRSAEDRGEQFAALVRAGTATARGRAEK